MPAPKIMFGITFNTEIKDAALVEFVRFVFTLSPNGAVVGDSGISCCVRVGLSSAD